MILAAILALAVVTLSVWQMLNKPKVPNQPSAPTNSQLTEEEKGQYVAQDFLTAYLFYTSGDFSNIESLYDQMTPGLALQEKARVEKLKSEISGKPIEYTTSLAVVKNYQPVESNPRLIIADITIAQQISDGAYLYNQETDSEKFVNRQGETTNPNTYALNPQVQMKTYRVILIKNDLDWKIDRLNKISQ